MATTTAADEGTSPTATVAAHATAFATGTDHRHGAVHAAAMPTGITAPGETTHWIETVPAAMTPPTRDRAAELMTSANVCLAQYTAASPRKSMYAVVP